MKIFFRADASPLIGSGHLTRCMTLASELRENGNEISFICEEQIGQMGDMLLNKGFDLYLLPTSNKPSQSDDYADKNNGYENWISVSELEDASRTIEIIKGTKNTIDWMIVDHYSLNAPWERAVECYVDKIMVIDDLYNREHECSILLNQNLHAEYNVKYEDLVPANCRKLLGAQYALLDPSYENLHQTTAHRADKIKNILVYFGGADLGNLTGKTLQIILDINPKDIEVNVVIPESHNHAREIENLILANKKMILHKGYIDLAPLMTKADLAIGAGGSTSWERCCLGLPSIIVAMSDNQLPIAQALEKEELIEFLGSNDSDFSERLRNSLLKTLEMKAYEEWSKKCKRIIDGKGVKRVVEAILNV